MTQRRYDDDDRRSIHTTVGQKIDFGEFAYRLPQFWKDPWISGAVFGRTRLALQHSSSVVHGIGPLIGVDVMLSAVLAPRGHVAQSVVGALGGQAAGLVGGLAGLAMGGPMGVIIGAVLSDPIGRTAAEKTFGTVLRETRLARELQTGGHYVDTEVAYTQRQRAAQEMSTSLLNARQWLGKESVLMHQ